MIERKQEDIILKVGQGKEEPEQSSLLPENSGVADGANRRSSEKERFVRMENEIKSLSQLVESLTAEIHDLKGIVQKEKESQLPSINVQGASKLWIPIAYIPWLLAT